MAADIVVKPVSDKSMLKTFVLFPWTSGIYKDDPAWVPPIISGQMKFLGREKGYIYDIGEVELFIAYLDGKPVGRISAHINRLYEKKYDHVTGFFGFFESIPSQNVADALFGSAENWLNDRGKTRIQGPQSFSIYDSVGFDVEGNDITPVVGLMHFRPYYKELAETYGFRKCIDWYCYLVRDIEDYQSYLREVKQDLMKNQNITYTTLQRKDIKQRARELHEIFNVAWDGNWGHLPLTDKQFEVFFRELKEVIIPELAIFAHDGNKTIGFCISIADANLGLQILNGRLYPWRLLKALKAIRRSKKIRTIVMGVLPEYRGRHIDDVFYLKTIETGVGMGFNASDCSLIVETNRKMIHAIEVLKAENYKTYRIFEKEIMV
ncbi:MAG: hypothetical protein M0P57_13510 [Syntrophales bacterium]|jgi:ribosomal protein S18 acetylase RimI-like enzyme|nr:hypothetical protein [Syntrophales bacterium]MDY0045268.1 hypothetical protein [Syntrophales bacterium]